MGSLFGKGGRRMIPRRGLSALVLGAALMSAAPPAGAASEEETAGARAMAQQGLEAFKAERFAEAADLFSRAESLVHSPVHLLYKARAHAKVGELVKAQEAYIKIIREKLPPKAPQAFRNAQGSAPAELETVKARLAHLTVTIIGPKEGAQLTLDGEEVPAALVGVPMPVDPGEHKLEASAEGYSSDSTAVTMAEAQREGIELRLEPIASAPETAAPVVTQSTTDAATAPPPDSAAGPNQGLRIGSYVAFGVGAVGLGLGTYFLLDGLSTADDSTKMFDACDPGCNKAEEAEIRKLDDDADSGKNLGTGGLVVGGLGVAAGLVLLVLSNESPEDAASSQPRITPWVGYNWLGVSGSF